jgi:hypothetical protein
LFGYDTDVNTYKEGTLRLSLVDKRQKILFERHGPNSIYKSQNESKAIAKFVDDMFAKFRKIANQQISFGNNRFNRNTKTNNLLKSIL